MQTDAANSLAAANKRIANLLKKQTGDVGLVDVSLFIEDAEKQLHTELNKIIADNKIHVEKQDYQAILMNLSSLHATVDHFFENVMVMADDDAVKNNRQIGRASCRERV